jgi:hypothetical protein
MHQCAIQLSGAKSAWDTRNTEAAADAKIMMQNISANLDAAQKKSWDLAYEKYNRNQVLKKNNYMISKRDKYCGIVNGLLLHQFSILLYYFNTNWMSICRNFQM